MTIKADVQELSTLKTIAETLNQSNDLALMLNIVLEKILELTGLTAGWIFLVDDHMGFECIADCNLPPALMHNSKLPMLVGSCWCLDRYGDGRLTNAVNILNCKRIENATEFQWGDTRGITHHATVPLRSGDRRFGVLNVAAPGKEHFSDKELALLQALAFQIGSAIERMSLYAAEQRRADLFARLGGFSSTLGKATREENVPEQLVMNVVTLISKHFEWPFVLLIEPVNNEFVLRALHVNGNTITPNTHFSITYMYWLQNTTHEHRFLVATSIEASELAKRQELIEAAGVLPSLSTALSTPVHFSGSNVTGFLIVGHERQVRSLLVEGEVLEALAEHIAVALESAELVEKRREFARLEVRNRLARDLHDSVCQMLFSLSMTAKGVEQLLGSNDQSSVLTSIKDIQSLSQCALKEMRALIMQLRPAGLEAGLITALKTYGEKLNLQISTNITGIRDLPRAVEEALWRIGQEALNNVSKHTDTLKAEVVLKLNESEAVLRISDFGNGLSSEGRGLSTHKSLGLSTMKERAEALHGKFNINSDHPNGTTIEVIIPLPLQETL